MLCCAQSAFATTLLHELACQATASQWCKHTQLQQPCAQHNVQHICLFVAGSCKQGVSITGDQYVA